MIREGAIKVDQRAKFDELLHNELGNRISPRSFEVDFCTVARWENGEIVEENLFYDVVGLMSQIGVGK